MLRLCRLFLGPLAVLLLAAPMFWSGLRAEAVVDDTKLEAFVTVALEVDRVMDEWRPKIATADLTKLDQLQAAANDDIVNTIKGSKHITFDEYQAIRKAVISNPDILTRITEIIRDRQQQ
jgi:hypothetical protein